MRGAGQPHTLTLQIPQSTLAIHSGHVALPVPSLLFALQLPAFGSGKAVAGHDALGLRILGRLGSFRPDGRLLFFARHDVLSEVSDLTLD